MGKRKISGGELVFQVCMVILFSLLFLSCAYPFYYVFIASISNPEAASRAMITFYPLQPTLDNYRQVLRLNGMSKAFVVSLSRTVIGTAVTMFFTSILAYTLTKRERPLHKLF